MSRQCDHKKKSNMVNIREEKRLDLGWLKGMPDVDFLGIGLHRLAEGTI